MQDPTYPLAPVVNVIAAFLVVLTLVTRGVRGTANRGVFMLAGWVLADLFITATQTIIWRDTYANIAPVYCDITTHLLIGSRVGKPACSFVITRRLWISIEGKLESKDTKRFKEVFVDYFTGLGVPVIVMALYYTLQSVRFEIIEGYGCSAAIYSSGVAFILVCSWPFIFPLASVSLYCWRILLDLYRRRQAVDQLFDEQSSINRARYTRVFLLGAVDMMLVLPTEAISYAITLRGVRENPIPFWPGWRIQHTDWAPASVPMAYWRADDLFRFYVYWNEWLSIGFAIAIFALFGWTRDTREAYGRLFGRARQNMSSFKAASSFGSTPVSAVHSEARVPRPISVLSPASEIMVRQDGKRGVELDGLRLDERDSGRLFTVDIGVNAEAYKRDKVQATF